MQLSSNPDPWIRILPMLGAVVVFGWGVFQFMTAQRAQAETRRIEATKPFLERQLKLYTEATQSAATLATSKSKDELDAASKRFWSLYWGELALVEDQRVEAAMVQFGRVLQAGSVGQELALASLQLAHACRESLADSWGVKQWRSPEMGAAPAH